MILTVHQPNFFPWFPFFEKMSKSDLFIILSHAQFNRRQFQNRFQIEKSIYTLPVKSGVRADLIKFKSYIEPASNWLRIKQKLNSKQLNEFDPLIGESLLETNSEIIKLIASKLDIQTEIKYDWEMPGYNASEKIVNLCRRFGATTYLSGPSGRNYLNTDLFNESTIKIEYHESNSRYPILAKLNYL